MTPPAGPAPRAPSPRSWVRRLLGAAPAPGPSAASASQDAASAPDGKPAPGEPVLFVGQPQYFRAAYEDAVRAGWGRALEVRHARKDVLRHLPEAVEAAGARTCVLFEPWLLAARPAAADAVRERGVRLVAYSTEPMPRGGGAPAHPDTLRRLENLRAARAVRWDLWLHHDRASEEFLRGEGFAPLEIQPLPVSERLFFPEEVERDVDVCFLGRSTPHREAFLEPLEARHRVVHVAHGLFDEEARRLMNRSKVVVNLHAHAYGNFETRCVQALFCGRPVVGEEVSGGELAAGVDYVLARTPEEMVERVGEILDGAGARALEPRFDRSRFLVASLRALLARGAPTGAAP